VRELCDRAAAEHTDPEASVLFLDHRFVLQAP